MFAFLKLTPAIAKLMYRGKQYGQMVVCEFKEMSHEKSAHCFFVVKMNRQFPMYYENGSRKMWSWDDKSLTPKELYSLRRKVQALG